VRPVGDALGLVKRLRGVRYQWDAAAHPGRNFQAGEQIGFIAQEVEEVLPEIVTDGKDGFK
jgi:hypothetical protein